MKPLRGFIHVTGSELIVILQGTSETCRRLKPSSASLEAISGEPDPLPIPAQRRRTAGPTNRVQVWHGGIELFNFNALMTRNSVDAGIC